MEEERGQLVDKIAGLKKKTAEIVSAFAMSIIVSACAMLMREHRHHRHHHRRNQRPHLHHPLLQKGFGPLLEATSNLRKEQEEEGKLAERMHEQVCRTGMSKKTR